MFGWLILSYWAVTTFDWQLADKHLIASRLSIITMDELKSIKRPHISLVKLIEAIGILLRLEKKAKSIYKVPSPSTYENVIDLMSNDFYGCLDILVKMKSESINNEVSSEFPCDWINCI